MTNHHKAFQFMVIGVPLIWFVATVFVFKGFAIARFRDSPTLQRLRKGWHLIPAYAALLFMWASLGFLQWYRQRIRNSSGKLGDESQWGFGQILALFVWAPTIVEFAYILICKSSHPSLSLLFCTKKTPVHLLTLKSLKTRGSGGQPSEPHATKPPPHGRTQVQQHPAWKYGLSPWRWYHNKQRPA